MAEVPRLTPTRVLAMAAVPVLAAWVGVIVRPTPPEAPPPPPTRPSLELSVPPPSRVEVRIDAVGFAVVGTHPLLAATPERPGAVVLPCTTSPCGLDGYDRAGLAALMRDIRTATPAAEVVLRPSGATPYRAVLDTLAAMREDDEGQLFPFVTVAAP